MNMLELLIKSSEYDEDFNYSDVCEYLRSSQSFKDSYKDFYDDIKISITEDW